MRYAALLLLCSGCATVKAVAYDTTYASVTHVCLESERKTIDAVSPEEMTYRQARLVLDSVREVCDAVLHLLDENLLTDEQQIEATSGDEQ